MENKNFLQRRNLCDSLLKTYSDRIPIVLKRADGCNDIPIIDKSKYLVPYNMTVGTFLLVIRKRLCLDSHKTLLLYSGNYIIGPASVPMVDVYNKHRSYDGFLYIFYRGERVFG